MIALVLESYLVEYDADDKKIFIGNAGSGGGDLPNPGCITEVSYPDYERVGRFAPGYVITGSDGNLYGYTYCPMIGATWECCSLSYNWKSWSISLLLFLIMFMKGL